MKPTPTIKILRLRPATDSDVPLPRYMTPHSAGMDICAAIEKDLTLGKGDIALLPSGFAVALPPGFEAQIRPRSGLAVKHGIGLVNSPGTIDADYRGEVKVLLVNLGQESFTVEPAMRVAQMVIAPVATPTLQLLDELPETDRGAGGFGSTGIS